ncbi:MAG: HAD hydrolase-like protein, partial [Chloroflexi bacterium]|nr:HAD hydrolase-like protein [Chloroflexota bacterium]
MAMDGTDGLTAVHDIQSIIFDFDYTLADSSDAVIECANYALRRLDLSVATDDAIRRTIGLSLPRTLTALAGEEHARHGDEFQRLFTERADVVMHDL